jgi:hypothetical protein
MSHPLVIIHVHPGVAWQVAFARLAAEGLRAAGISFDFTVSPRRVGSGLPILLGTTFWRAVEADGPFLLVDRCSFGDPTTWVSLVRDGHGRRGDHRVPETRDGSRWKRCACTVEPWIPPMSGRVILCGQQESFSPHYQQISDWYDVAAPGCTHYRRHPAVKPADAANAAAQRLPAATDWRDTARAVTLNSSVAVDTVLRGIPTVTMDEAAMAWDVSGHTPAEEIRPDRTEWLHWLAWTQWHHDEISEGTPWRRFL